MAASDQGQGNVLVELLLAKAKLQEKIEAENLTIHETIHTDRPLAKMALKRKKSLMTSLQVVQERIDTLQQDMEGSTNSSNWFWNGLESFEFGSGWKILVAVFALGISGIIGAFVNKQE
eukprot:GFUD01004211.1.p2 GENE.GFUD01004211.1~~GFUD01004211.1.p2  ORF type:complete len:119 (-),score=46.34 GFUD01004211.1:424-780(-)